MRSLADPLRRYTLHALRVAMFVGIILLPPHQNLWVNSGSGKAPRL